VGKLDDLRGILTCFFFVAAESFAERLEMGDWEPDKMRLDVMMLVELLTGLQK
jgi:hypothetical protein